MNRPESPFLLCPYLALWLSPSQLASLSLFCEMTIW